MEPGRNLSAPLMLWPAKRCLHSTFARVARRTFMVRDRTALFKRERSPLFFCREDPAIRACVEHVGCRSFHQSRPRRTASHFCSIPGNPAPLTCDERPPVRAHRIVAESAGELPPWTLYRGRGERVAHCHQRSLGPSWYRSDSPRVGCFRLLTQHNGPALGNVCRWRAATRHGTTFRHALDEGR